MTRRDDWPPPGIDWQPATSQPGEMYSPAAREHSIRMMGRLRSADARERVYRRSMRGPGWVFVAIAGAVVVVAVIASLVA